MQSLTYMVDASLVIEKLRVQSEVRISHLKRNGREDPDTDDLHQRIEALENFVDGRVAVLITSHPAYPWFSKVKGVGKENIGKVVAQVRIKPERGEILNHETDEVIWKDLPYADTISALWKFAGFAPVDGHSMKRTKGEKLEYNSQLRSMCWRMATSLLRARGKFYEYYLEQKEVYEQRFANAGTKIVPATQLPKVDGKKTETEVIISEGHVHNMALRKMIKLFLACLWLEWRKAEGLPITAPYAIDKLGHASFISPDEMVDR